MQTPTDTYLTDETYHTLKNELAHLIAIPFVHDPETEVIRILGEIGGVWPESVMDDAENAENRIIPKIGSTKAA